MMQESTVKNFHLPLPTDLYDKLKKEAERSKKPTTVIARQAIEEWLKEKQRKIIYETVAAYAQEVGGTNDDLDENLEKAAIEFMMKEGE